MAAVLPAEPILASSLIGDDELESVLSRVFEGKKKLETKDMVSTGVRSVDEALEGGLQRGCMVGVSGEMAAGAGDICTALLVTSLLEDTTASVAVIDTTGNFDIVRIYTLILSRIQQDEELLRTLRAADPDASIEDLAAKVLDRVKIMRVFDFVGCVEAVGEIRDGLEGRTRSKEATPAAEQPANAIDEEVQGVSRAETVMAVDPQVIEAATWGRVIADSQEEGEEMLFDSEVATQIIPIPSQEPPVHERQPLQSPDLKTQLNISIPQPDLLSEAPQTPQLPSEPPSPSKTFFILIDNLAHILSPLLKKDYIQANNLLTTLLHSLSHLTHTHSLLTILSNPATIPRPQSPIRKISGPPPPQQVPTPPPSIFSDVKAVPALGNILPVFLDVGLMVSKVPRQKVDARALHNEGYNKQAVKWVNVVEVLSDRLGERTGGWGTFLVDQERGIKDL